MAKELNMGSGKPLAPSKPQSSVVKQPKPTSAPIKQPTPEPKIEQAKSQSVKETIANTSAEKVTDNKIQDSVPKKETIKRSPTKNITPIKQKTSEVKPSRNIRKSKYYFDEHSQSQSPDDSVGHKLKANFMNGMARGANNYLRHNTDNIIGDVGDRLGIDMAMNPFQRMYFMPLDKNNKDSFEIKYTGFVGDNIKSSDVRNALAESLKEYLPNEMSNGLSLGKESIATRAEMDDANQKYSQEALGIDESSRLRSIIQSLGKNIPQHSLNPSLNIQTPQAQSGYDMQMSR